MKKSLIAVIVLSLASIGAVRPARAQFMQNMTGPSPVQNIEGFTVAGKGSVAVKPNLIEIDLEVAASSELTGDAIVKYRDARRRIHDAFTALKLANVTVEERGLLVDQKGMQNPYYFGGYQPNTRNKTEVQLTRKLVVKATNVRTMDEDALLQLIGKLLDVAQDAGGHVGPQNVFNPYYYNPYQQGSTGLVRFVLDDYDKLQEEAYEQAIADARARAQRLARLSHVELGPIMAIREITVPGDRTSNSDDELPRKRLETGKFQEIPVRVELLVRFEVHAKSDAKGQAGAR
ncbi:MAG: SIMPL domain-containing protein [Isosphaerales bacterium]